MPYLREPIDIIWQGTMGDDLYRVVAYDDSYGGGSIAVEWLDQDEDFPEPKWCGVSYGRDQDAPEVAQLTAHVARLNVDLRTAVERLLEAVQFKATVQGGEGHFLDAADYARSVLARS